MSYIHKKTRAFQQSGDAIIRRKRSEGRMKTYRSATDTRAWCDHIDERRQYILELVREESGKELSLGKYIPIEAIIDILLANKNMIIEELQRKIEKLRKILRDNNLNDVVSEPLIKKEIIHQLEKDPQQSAEGDKETSEQLEETEGRVHDLEKEGVTSEPVSDGGYKSSPTSDEEDNKDEDQLEAHRKGEDSTEPPTDSDYKTSPSSDDEESTGKASSGKKTIKKVGISSAADGKIAEEGSDDGKSIDEDSADGKTTEEASADKKTTQKAPPGEKTTEKTSPDEDSKTKSGPLQKKEKLSDETEEQLESDEPERALAIKAITKLESIKNIADGKEDAKKTEESDLGDDTTALKKRLNLMKDLEGEIRKLRDRAVGAGDSVDKDELLTKIKQLENEKASSRHKLKEMDILKCEKNCLQKRCQDLAEIQKDYEKLLKKTRGFDSVKADAAMYKAKYEQLQHLEDEYNKFREKIDRCEELEKERQLLLKEIENCECCMSNQENEIKKLTCHLQCLTQDLDQRQDEMKVKVLTLRAHIERKDFIISKSEEQLADVQDQLSTCIESLSCETTCLRTRIEELEDEITELQNLSAAKDENYKALEAKYKLLQDNSANYEENIKSFEKAKQDNHKLLETNNASYEETLKSLEKANQVLSIYEEKIKSLEKANEAMSSYEEKIKSLEKANQALSSYEEKIKSLEKANQDLLADLEDEKSTNYKLEEALRKAVKTDEHLNHMLKQAKCAIKCIMQKFETQEIVSAGKLKQEKEMYLRKIKEMEEGMKVQPESKKVAELENELTVLKAENKCLCDNMKELKGVMEENDRLNKLVAEFQGNGRKF